MSTEPQHNETPPTPSPADAIFLYVAGDASTSLRARDTLTSLLSEIAMPPEAVEIVDVIASPVRALEDGVLVTPTLRVRHGDSWTTIVGDLNDDAVVRRLISRSA